MSPRRLLRAAWWAQHWSLTVVYLVVVAVFVIGLAQVNSLREDDRLSARQHAEQLREAQLRFCESSNERTALLHDFVLGLAQDPDPRQYEFIEDPALRQGVLDQARRSRAETRDRVNRTFTQRDCAGEVPALPPNN